MKKLHKEITIILAACAFALIIALALNAYIASIAHIHRIKLGEVIIDWYTFNGIIDNGTMAMGISFVSNSSIYVKIDKLPFSFGYDAHKVTIYRYGPDWLELSIGERG